MQLLRELLEQAKKADTAAVDDIINSRDPVYVSNVVPGPTGKGKKKKPATTDAAQNSLIQTLWFYNNSDAD